MTTNETLRKGLEIELLGYIARGLTDRAELVRQELARLGANPLSTDGGSPVPSRADTSLKPVKKAAKKPSKGR